MTGQAHHEHRPGAGKRVGTVTIEQTTLGPAIGRSLKVAGVTPEEVAALLGHKTPETVRSWMRGTNIPNPYKVAALEQALGLSLGWVGRAAGLVDDEGLTVRERIASDPMLDGDPDKVATVLRVYDFEVNSPSSRKSPKAANPAPRRSKS